MKGYANNWILFTWSALAKLSAALFLIYNAFVTLFKHNFTNFSTHSETYINSLQKHMLIFFGKHFEVRPQLMIQSSKICFHEKIKDQLFRALNATVHKFAVHPVQQWIFKMLFFAQIICPRFPCIWPLCTVVQLHNAPTFIFSPSFFLRKGKKKLAPSFFCFFWNQN